MMIENMKTFRSGQVMKMTKMPSVRIMLRCLYYPYKWFFFVPVLILSTVIVGSLATVMCYFVHDRIPGYYCGKIWAMINALATPILVRVSGREHVEPRQSYVVVSNHQSQYDIFVIYGFLNIDFKWVMKKELRKIPFLGVACEKMGHIFIDRSNPEAAVASLNAAKRKIRDGVSVFFFPEGTRTRTGRLLPFKKGAFRMALELGLPILPVTIQGTREILPPDTADIFPGSVSLKIHPPVSTESYHDENLPELMDRVRKIIAAPVHRRI